MRKPHWELIQGNPEKHLFAFRGLPSGVTHRDVTYISGDILRSIMETRRDKKFEKVPHEMFSPLLQFGIFRKSGERIYKIAKDFGEQLAKVDISISAKFLPLTSEIISIEFPDSIKFLGPKNRVYTSVYIGSSILSHFHNDQVQGNYSGVRKLLVHMIFPTLDESGVPTKGFDLICPVFTDENESIEDAIEDAKRRAKPDAAESVMYWGSDAIKYALKCLVYIHTGEPDLRGLRAPKPPQTEKAKKLRRWEKLHSAEPLVDVILVGYDFKKPVAYKVGETSVTGHFRWQRHGENFTKIKLIWIDEHLRIYKEASDEICFNTPSIDDSHPQP